nr:MAG TPA: hypothetical protein [Caudoviricetes sp.]
MFGWGVYIKSNICSLISGICTSVSTHYHTMGGGHIFIILHTKITSPI